MIQTFSATTEMFLSDLATSEARSSKDIAELSSGYSVSSPSDAPADVVTILQVQNQMAQTTQVTNNLNRLQNEVNTGESVLDEAVSLLQQANVLGAQALGVGQTAQTMQALAIQVSDLQQQIVGLSQTAVSGRYIFSGDNDQAAQYTLTPPIDPSTGLPNPPINPLTGVARMFNTEETRQIADVSGATFTAAATAQDIFDQTDSSGNPTANNVFAALQQLYNGLMAGPSDAAGINQAIGNIKSASVWLNNNLAFYGTVQNRISSSMTIASKYQTQWTQQISGIRDADTAAVASDLQATHTQQSAALAAEANFQPQSLFDYLK
jgi:flagellar hook-associated protein 3 FlgL